MSNAAKLDGTAQVATLTSSDGNTTRITFWPVIHLERDWCRNGAPL